MKQTKNDIWVCLLVAGMLLGASTFAHAQTLPVINEVVTANITGIPDEYDIEPDNCPVEDCEQWYADLGESVYDGDYPGWVEIYNPTGAPISLNGVGLSDDPDEPLKWTFPNITLAAGNYILVFVSGKDRSDYNPPSAYLHTNFKLNENGESLYLSNAAGTMIDVVNADGIHPDFSRGRSTDGAQEWVTFIEPTPLQANAGETFTGYSDEITTSTDPGVYGAMFTLGLSTQTDGAEIRYTLDGSEPDPGATLYEGPISINRTRIVRARAYLDGRFISPVFTGSYIVGAHSLPVVSVTTPPENLWDGTTGIYTPGKNANEGIRIANYWNDWERPANVELFEPGEAGSFSIDAGIRIFGWGSRANERRSLAVMVRERYGTRQLNYPLIPGSGIERYKSFVLRAAGQDWQSTLIRDPLMIRLADGLDLDRQLFRHCVLYLNGEFWGIYNIRSKINEDYLASHHPVDKDNVDMISRYWRRTYPILIEGSDAEYLAMENFIVDNDMSDPQAYGVAARRIDVRNLADYLAVNIYGSNGDWPGNNNKCWRPNQPAGPWRWIMYDLDNTFSLNSFSDPTRNTLELATAAGGTTWPNPEWTTKLIRNILEGPEFSDRFILKTADLLNTVFLPANIREVADSLSAVLEPEMPDHIDRWGMYEGTLTSMSQWNENLSVISDFAEARPDIVRDHLSAYFGLDDWHRVHIFFNVPDAGTVKLNSVHVDRSGWNGLYPEGVSFAIRAMPAPGYRFSGWSGIDGTPESPVLRVDPYEEMMISMNVVEDTTALNRVVINEICYNAGGPATGDWVELYNGYGVGVDLGGWILRDGAEGNRFRIPDGTVVPSHGYLVVSEDSSALRASEPGIPLLTGNFRFGLAREGDTVRLFDDRKQLADRVVYGNRDPWPVTPDGFGPTLSLISPGLDNVEAEHWTASAGTGGTPGRANTGTGVAPGMMESTFRAAAFPNPFREQLNFMILSDNRQEITIQLCDLHGRLIAPPVQKQMVAGQNRVTIDMAARLPDLSGIIYYTITGKTHTLHGKVLRME